MSLLKTFFNSLLLILGILYIYKAKDKKTKIIFSIGTILFVLSWVLK